MTESAQAGDQVIVNAAYRVLHATKAAWIARIGGNGVALMRAIQHGAKLRSHAEYQ